MYEYAEMLQSESYTPSYVEELQMDCNLLQRLNDYLVVVCDNLAYIHMIWCIGHRYTYKNSKLDVI